MKLSDKQGDFLFMVNDLLTHIRPVIETNNMILKVTEWNRHLETQQRYMAEGLTKTLNSLHLQNLAVDFALIKNGKFLNESEVYDMMGEYWQSIGGRWGGEFTTLKDYYHFEYNHKRRQSFKEGL